MSEFGQSCSAQFFEILARMVRRPRQRAGRDEQEALGHGHRAIGLELVRGHEAHHRMVLLGGSQILANGEEIHIGVGGYAANFNPREALKSFKEKTRKLFDLENAELAETRGGRIPVGGRRVASRDRKADVKGMKG